MLKVRRHEIPENNGINMTPLMDVIFQLLVFFVLAMQCLPTTAVVRRELGSWKWALFQLAYMTVLAWGAATLVYQGGRLLGLA